MDSLVEIFDTTLVPIPCDILDGIGLAVVQTVSHGVFDRLDLVFLIV